MAVTPTPPERPSQREQDLLREIEQATGWPRPQGSPPHDHDRDRGKQTPEEAQCPPTDA